MCTTMCSETSQRPAAGNTLYRWRAVHLGGRCHCVWLLRYDSLMLCHQGLDLLVDYDFVAIFDADFKPEPDFLVRLLLRAIVKRTQVNAQIPHGSSAVCWCVQMVLEGSSPLWRLQLG